MRDALRPALPIFSRPLAVSDALPEGLTIEIVAHESERAALAELNAIPAVLSLNATLRARRWRGEGLEIDGEMRARVRQTCVATLEEFETDIVEPLHLRFAPPRDAKRSRRRPAAEEIVDAGHVLDPLGEDPPDPLIGETVDLGAIVSEFLTLALDPYPRMPGAKFAEPAPASGADVLSPFAALKAKANQTPQE